MDERAEFDKIITDYGHDVLLQRRTQDQSCESPTYSDTLERHTTRHMLPGTRGLPMVQQEREEGLVNTAERIYWFRYNVNPFEGDRIYEYDNESVRVGKVVFNIDSVVAMRGRGGRIIYWTAGATRVRPN